MAAGTSSALKTISRTKTIGTSSMETSRIVEDIGRLMKIDKEEGDGPMVLFSHETSTEGSRHCCCGESDRCCYRRLARISGGAALFAARNDEVKGALLGRRWKP